VKESAKAICVLGIPRSGTSLTARLLNLLGVYLGNPDHLLGPSPSNEAGHWENVHLLAINEALLARLGGSWDRPPPLPPGWEDRPDLADLRAQAAVMLAGEFREATLWGWKDPRNTLTFPFWKALVPGLQGVLCVRHPVAVALSLQARNGFPPARSFRLWWTYNRVALRYLTASQSRWTVVFYEDCLEQPTRALARLASFIGLKGREREEAIRRAREAIKPRLRHHTAGGSPAIRLPPPTVRLHEHLREIATHLPP